MNRGSCSSCKPLTLALVLAALVHASARAEGGETAPDVARAEALAASAYDAYARADYAAAVALYRQALDAAPSANTLYNLARIYDTKLHDRDQAIAFYERYSRDTGADPGLLRTTTERLARLHELQQVASETAPARPLPSATPAPREQPEPLPAAPQAPQRVHAGLSGWQAAGLVIGPVGLAGVGLGIGFGLAAKADNDDAKTDCDGNRCQSQQGVDAAHDAKRKADISTVAFIAGGVLTALGATLLIWGGQRSDERDERPAVAASLYIGPGTAGSSIVGRW